jgi:restriction endonuclease S subunit
LEGLEISVLNFKEFKLDNDFSRLDSEYFNKKNLEFEKKIKKFEFLTLEKITQITSGKTPQYDIDGTIPVIRSGELNYKWLNTDCLLRVKSNKDLFYLKKKDILISSIGLGSIGKVDLFFKDGIYATVSEVTVLRNSKVNPYFMAEYLSTKFGQSFINKYITGATGQLHLNKSSIKNILVPILKVEFQKKIEDLVSLSFLEVYQAKDLYSQAETLLLETLGLNNFEPMSEAVNVKSFKESFLSSGRLDAEYYQKKYEEITVRIKSHKYNQLGNLVDIKKSIEPGSDAYQEEGVPFIRVSNLNKMGLSEPDIHLDGMKYKDVVKPRKDTILLSKDGSVGIAYKVTEDMNAITSGAILHLSVKTDEVLPDYLTLVLNSKVVQMQAERDAGGSILQHWKPSEIAQVEIPIIDKQVQQQIASLVSESFALKKQSEQLLETAKRAVEIAIEEGEEMAMQYII